MPQLADGLDLIGEFQESGFEEPPWLVRRADGQMVQLTKLLFTTLQAVDGRRDLGAIATEVSAKLGRRATAENVEFLLEQKLRPLGLLKAPDGSNPPLKKSSPLLALRWRMVLSSERVTNRITAPFSILFRRPVVALIVPAFFAVAVWILFFHGVGASARQALYSPALLLVLFALTVLSAGFHEFGHASACRFGGARPGVMGAGIYLVWPAFYTDVTDSYRLDRRGRLRTDLGGLYFNAIFLLAMVAVWAITGMEAFLLGVPLQLFEMMHQLMPFIRMDGYNILSDLTGVPDLFARIKPTVASAIPGHHLDQRAARLKPWVRATVTIWVLIVIPLMVLSVVLAVIAMPRLVATGWDSLVLQTRVVRAAAHEQRWLTSAAAALSMFALLLPAAGSMYMVGRFVRRIGQKVWSGTRERPALRAAAGAGVVVVLAALAWLWWPNGEYRPIQVSERGTIIDGVRAAGDIPTGRPSLTAARASELGGAPLRSDRPSNDPAPSTTEPATTTEPVASTSTSTVTATSTAVTDASTDTAAPSTDIGEPTSSSVATTPVTAPPTSTRAVVTTAAPSTSTATTAVSSSIGTDVTATDPAVTDGVAADATTVDPTQTSVP